MNKWYDFLFAFNCGLYAVVVVIWFFITFKFPVYKCINGGLWGLVLGVSILGIIFDAYWFFKEEKK